MFTVYPKTATLYLTATFVKFPLSNMSKNSNTCCFRNQMLTSTQLLDIIAPRINSHEQSSATVVINKYKYPSVHAPFEFILVVSEPIRGLTNVLNPPKLHPEFVWIHLIDCIQKDLEEIPAQLILKWLV